MPAPVVHPFAAPPLRPGPAAAGAGAAILALLVSIGLALLVCAGAAP